MLRTDLFANVRIHLLRPALAALACITATPSAHAQGARPASETFAQLCATCHGPQGRGGSAPSLVDDQWLHGSDEASLRKTISEGYVDRGMPGFQAALAPADIDGLIAYLRSEYTDAKRNPPPAVPLLPTDAAKGFRTELVTDGIETPWGLDWLPDGTLLITERPGRLRLFKDGKLSAPVRDTPAVDVGGQAGLLDVAVHPNYADNGWIYLAFSHPSLTPKGRKGSMTKIVRGKIVDGTWRDEQAIWQAPAKTYKPAGGVHFGCRIAFDGQGHLFFSHGERGSRDDAQDLTLPNGKIHRVWDDGRIPDDNPFVKTPDAIPSIWSYGNRNPQGLTFDARTGILWETEHGPRGGDELNVILSGHNYGWPVITYGIDYDGTLVSPLTEKEGMDQPKLHWTPSIAVASVAVYEGEAFPQWRHSLLVSSLARQELRRVIVEGDRAVSQEVILAGIGRLRHVTVGPDGLVYLAVNEPDRILRLVPVSKE